MHNITSPRTDDSAIEQEIVAKGKTAPRITPAQVEQSIVSEHYFTADQGARAAQQFDAFLNAHLYGEGVVDTSKVPKELSLLTFCVLVLGNGFTVTGESACASPENFDDEIGRKIARKNATEKIWPLLGFELRTTLTKLD